MYKIFFLLILNLTSLFALNWTNYSGDYKYYIDVNNAFSELQNRNVYGDFVATGDSILFVDDGSTPNLIDSHTAYKLEMNIPVFASATDARKRNSSTATLNLPPYVTSNDIVWAGLFWQGHINELGIAGKSDDWIDNNVTGWENVTIASQDGATSSVTADSTKVHHIAARGANSFRYSYGAYADVTNFVKSKYTAQSKQFTVGNIMTTQGKESGTPLYINNAQPPLFLNENAKLGYYGGWSLIVIYNIVNPATVTSNNVKLKNVAIFDGYDFFLTWGEDTVPFEKDIVINGFYTPLSGPINSKLLFFGGAGDKNINKDSLKFLNTSGTFVNLNNSPNPAGDQFNHTYTNLGLDLDTNATAPTNKQGMDLDTYDVSAFMSNGQSSATIKFGVVKTGAGLNGYCDQTFPQVIGFSTELFQPSFCYDYAYKQNGKYFTEDFNITKGPHLLGENLLTSSSNPISMSLFLRNTVNSDINVTNIKMSVTDINATQASYITNTTAIAKNSTTIKTSLPSVALTDIPIGTISSNEFVYVYYDLNPKLSNINMPIKVNLDYTITINNTDINYTSQIPSVDIPLCPQGGSSYDAVSGVFNIVHNNYYDFDSGGTNRYYNLPTQITKREGNFKVISLKNDGIFDTLEARDTMVAVDMIDVSAFQSTYASCNELTMSITNDKVWIKFDGTNAEQFNQQALQNAITEGMTDLTSASDYYKMARRNVAFRVTYNTTNDINSSIVKTEKVGNNYKILNYTALVQGIGTCAQTVASPSGNSGNTLQTNQISVACGNAGNSGVSKRQLRACMECIYGYHTKAICSRDNFSIRPEAFLIKLNDQNQSNPTQKKRISEQVSGLTLPVATITDYAAGYQYYMEANATDFLGNDGSFGYTKQFNLSHKNTAKYLWEPRNAHIVTDCNDTINRNTYVRFTNGLFGYNTSLSQVGEYRLNITDTSWTIVDNDPAYMTHHVAPYFITPPTRDCILNSGVSQAINSANLNGCNISSSHANINANLIYNDYNITSHPYKFDVSSIKPTVGLNHADVNASSYVYMSDMSKDENMSFHLNGSVTAVGYTGSSLKNFANQCYAEPLSIDVNKSIIAIPLAYQAVFHSLGANGSIIRTLSQDLNNSSDIIPMATLDFPKENNGSAQTQLNLNFNRTTNSPQNPQEMTFTKYDVNCTITANCKFNADLIPNKFAQGTKNLNLPIKHYYGRTHAKRQRFTGPAGTVNIYYETYCSGGGCDKTLLQDGIDSNSTDDPRWFINAKHTIAFGDVGPIVQRTNVSQNVNATPPTPTTPATSLLTYNVSKGYPYKATMELNSSSWLIYNQFDANATFNQFEVEFTKNGSPWAGPKRTDTKTNNSATTRTNRRTMW